MSRNESTLEVWLDDGPGPARQVGTLAHDRGQIRFHYERNWLDDPRAFALDPDLSLDEYPFFPKPELGNFGIFLDSSPDRWGQTLMKRREALQAKDEKRPPGISATGASTISMHCADGWPCWSHRAPRWAVPGRRPTLPKATARSGLPSSPPATMTGTSAPGSMSFINWPGKPVWRYQQPG